MQCTLFLTLFCVLSFGLGIDPSIELPSHAAYSSLGAAQSPACPPGMSCGLIGCSVNMTLPCPEAYYCPKDTSVRPCPSKYYCPDPMGSTYRPCPQGHFCRERTANPPECSLWSFCPKKTSRQMVWVAMFFSFIALFVVFMSMWFVDHRRMQKEQELLMSEYQMEPSKSKGGDGSSFFDSSESDHWHLVQTPPMNVRFEELGLTIMDGKVKKTILEGVTGHFKSGRLTGVLGPSGAGKTTFITVLMNKVRKTTGSVWVNGIEGNLSDYHGHVGYVPQMDSMLPFLTVQETLVHSALTRLPRSWSHKRRMELIAYAVEVLGLKNIIHTLIGEPGSTGGLTMGQRKCVSIAVELVANPSVLIADEPTTALDATSACEVLQCLRTVASQGKNVIAVIHQPRLEIYDMFDDVLLIGVGGRTVFLGSCDLVMPYFETVLEFSCPEKTNPPDFFLDVLSGKMGSKGRDMFTPWVNEGAKFLQENGTSDVLGGEEEKVPQKTDSVLRPTLVFQYIVFLLRCVRQWKDFKRIVMACFTHFLAGFICGVSFMDGNLFVIPIPIQYTQYGICPHEVAKNFCVIPQTDDIGLLSMYIIMAVGLAAVTMAIQSFGDEKLTYYREVSSGVNSLAYYLAKITTDIPLFAFYTLLFMGTFTLLASPRGRLDQYYIVFFALEFAVWGFGYTLSMFVRRENCGLVSVVLVLIWAVCNGGPFNVHKMGILGTISYPRWIGEAVFIVEIRKDELTANQREVVEYYVKHEVYMYNLDNLGADIGMAFAIGVAFRIIAYLLLRFTKRSRQR
eukprot:TRINITY_DN16664_c0_g1_i1.p1 TRINITY_DN16664_c0_g1~~TRINITY_DN16664_c0_g1_i1.p1  ORF type:complete len:812 (-),score=177.77 TRINITY_DN16664_c0_g1_i1:105-2474(-)